MALPADFPQPPADTESLAAAVAWIFQVLSWLIARAAAGDEWWKAGETDAAPRPWGRQATGEGQGATQTSAAHGAERAEAGANLAGLAPEAARRTGSAPPTGQSAEPAPAPLPPRPAPWIIPKEPSPPPLIRPVHHRRGGDPKGGDRRRVRDPRRGGDLRRGDDLRPGHRRQNHRWPTAGPIALSRRCPTAPSHAHNVTMS